MTIQPDLFGGIDQADYKRVVAERDELIKQLRMANESNVEAWDMLYQAAEELDYYREKYNDEYERMIHDGLE